MLQNGLAVLYYLWGTGQRPVRRPTPAKRRFVPNLGHGTASREFRHTFEPASRALSRGTMSRGFVVSRDMVNAEPTSIFAVESVAW